MRQTFSIDEDFLKSLDQPTRSRVMLEHWRAMGALRASMGSQILSGMLSNPNVSGDPVELADQAHRAADRLLANGGMLTESEA